MTDVDSKASEWDVGGLHFAASFRSPAGATLRVSGPFEGDQKELLRFDDFADSPHYHLPGDGEPVMFDRSKLGEPLDWLVAQVRDHFDELLTAAGFADGIPGVDARAVADSAERIRKAMVECVPDGYVRVAGIGLQRDS